MLPELGGSLLVQHEVHIYFSELGSNHLRAFKHTDIQVSPTEFPFQAHFENPTLAEPPVYKCVPAQPSRVQARACWPTAQLFEEARSDHPLVCPQTAPLLQTPPLLGMFVQQTHLPPLRPNSFLSSPPFGLWERSFLFKPWAGPSWLMADPAFLATSVLPGPPINSWTLTTKHF